MVISCPAHWRYINFLIGIIVVLPLNYDLEAILMVQFIQGLSMVTFGTLFYFGWLTRGMEYYLWSKQKLKHLFNFGAKLLVIGLFNRP